MSEPGGANPFREAQGEVIFLGPVPSAVEPADCGEHLPPHGQQCAGIGQATQQIEVEVGLEMRAGQEAVRIDAGFVAVERLPFGMAEEGVGHGEESMRSELVPAIDQGNPVRIRVCEHAS